jgi:hypothetical protein
MKCKHKKGVECYLMKCENCKIFKEVKQTTLNIKEGDYEKEFLQ